MQKKKEKTICLVVHYLAFGGLARAAANLSIALDKIGYKVVIVTVHKDVSFTYAGTLINMGDFKSENNSLLNRLSRFYILKKKLKRLYIDIFIDLRTRTSFPKEFFLNKWIYKSKVIYTIHSADYQKYICFDVYKFKKLNNKSLGVVTVSNWLTNEFKNKLEIINTQTIYNPIHQKEILENIDDEINIKGSFILAVGQMNNSLKGFDHLIKAYEKSIARKNNKSLVIIGGGSMLENYKELARELKIEKQVLFLGMVTNPFKYYAQADFFVLSSKNEGFPTVILEALICGCPVVSYDCLSGPSEIIKNRENGLLVKNQEIDALSSAINLFVEDEQLRDYCKSNAVKSVEKFSFDNIGKDWETYLNKTIK